MFNMEPKSSKGISWIDDMYEKIGVIYKGVDDNKFFQETGKFVECQVTTVGENLQKFCAEIVQELLAPPVEHTAKGSPTDSSLSDGKDTSGQGKVKEGIEGFSPLVEDMPALTGPVAAADTGRDEHHDASIDEIGEINKAACSKNCEDTAASTSAIVLNTFGGKASIQCDSSDLIARSLPPESDIRASSCVAQPPRTVELQEQLVLPQDTFPSASSGFSDDSIKCVDKTVDQASQTGNSNATTHSIPIPLVNLEVSQNGKRKTGSNAKLIHPISRSAVSSQKVKDDDYEQVAYWYGDIDSELTHNKEISPLNHNIHDAYMDQFVCIDGYESEWELL